MSFFKRKGQQEDNDDITNPELVDAMCAVAMNDSPETRQTLYEAFLRSILIIPVYGEIEGLPDNEWRVSAKPVDICFIGGKDKQGQTILYTFTDVESLLAWNPRGCRYVGMAAQDVFKFVIDNNFASIIVNYKGPTGGILSRSEIEDLAEGKIPQRFEFGIKKIEMAPGIKMKYGLPTKPPSEELVKRLQEMFKSLGSIAEAYLFLGQLGQEKPELVVGLVLSGGRADNDMPEIVQSLSDVTKPFLSKDEFINFLELRGEMLLGVRGLDGAKFYSAI